MSAGKVGIQPDAPLSRYRAALKSVLDDAPDPVDAAPCVVVLRLTSGKTHHQ
jgi:uncharacterized protein YfaQ (DUF2300 family)